MKEIRQTHVDEQFLDTLLGIESSKIGFYGEVKQKIQELEAANLGLRVKKTELQAVFDAISDGVVIYDRKGMVQHRNHVCPKLFPRETLMGKSCQALFHPEQELAPASCPVEKALQGESSQLSFSTTHQSGGRNQFYDVIATPIPTPLQDAVSGNRALVFIRNVTERRTRELQLLQAEKMSSIGVLAAGVAHEINNPMTSVAGYAEALQRRFREDATLAGDLRLLDFPKYLEVIVREVYRCKGIIESLLSFSRKSDGVFGLVDLNQIIGEVLELVSHKGLDDQILLREDLSVPLPLVQGDASALQQVFLNLILNALQAIEVKGVVTILTRVDEGQVVARVIDTGVGIAPEVLDQIWNPFFTTKVVGKGQGLGLAVTYDIIEKHKGEIEVHSNFGQGTEFIVRLPICQDI
ncbi:two-component system sensor histidine kinase NtrB [Geopsychrobacter electrodiphilus]|uniref:two-component system sensor histidine kinase NtrB n=1 Tax=Geopsychrobacter electrodiphilus TaxID=225196 RepID=UPI00036281EC|nr:ATP-binding protein [Geopsychrobacter electrodiphilus]